MSNLEEKPVETTEETELECQAKELFGDLVVIEDSPDVYEESEEYSHDE